VLSRDGPAHADGRGYISHHRGDRGRTGHDSVRQLSCLMRLPSVSAADSQGRYQENTPHGQAALLGLLGRDYRRTRCRWLNRLGFGLRSTSKIRGRRTTGRVCHEILPNVTIWGRSKGKTTGLSERLSPPAKSSHFFRSCQGYQGSAIEARLSPPVQRGRGHEPGPGAAGLGLCPVIRLKNNILIR
jgi:hypothetical protein